MPSTSKIGETAENLAAEFLKNSGLKILEKNVRTRFGEIDIIAKDKKTIVIVEVRAKKNEFSGRPVETVNYKKQEKVLNMARWYLADKKLLDKDSRIDVVGVTLGTPIQFEWIKNAVGE